LTERSTINDRKQKALKQMSPRNPKQFEEIREKSKEKILYAAFELFSSIGYWSTSISKIAKQAGISKGLMYNYFNSKEHLLKAVIEKILEVIKDVINFDEEDKTPEENMTLLITRIFAHIEKNGSMIRMMAKISLQIGQFDFVNEILVKEYKTMINKAENLLSQMNFKNPRQEALILGAAIDGVLLQQQIFGEEYPLQEIKEAMLTKYTKEL